ncbi:HCLS1-associated protein X-1 isoform X3 [Amia ocellicauda]|uniref:HCLS1-associated protein X-1 isoform X3 n=1 Tax=Amia ocellicauda TaxID=2972642 RepID=UPI0034649627
MSLFDLFRGFFGLPGSRYPGDRRSCRDPFFDSMTHDGYEDNDDDDDDAERGSGQLWDEGLRFGVSVGPGGVRLQEPAAFRELFREVEELMSAVERWERMPGLTPFEMPSIEAPPPSGGLGNGGGLGRGGSLRDFMLKHPDGPSSSSPDTGGAPDRLRPHMEDKDLPSSTHPPIAPWSPFSKFEDVWRGGLWRREESESVKEDRDLDSRVSSEGLDTVLSPQHPRSSKFFQSVTVTKVVSPDGTVEERRTVRDSQGNEKTTVTRSGPSDRTPSLSPQQPPGPGVPPSDPGMQDDFSIFSRFFGGFRNR